jgi:flagellar biosynthesis/type III secretory pathway chaperone
MKTSQALLNELEALFISEFRACQAIYDLTSDERRALSQGDVERLQDLTHHKEKLLDKLSWIEAAKVDLLQELEVLPDKTPNTLRALYLIDFLSTIDQTSAQRLLRIQEGSLILRSQVREMTRGNRSLAVGALERTNSLQTHLLRLYQLPAVDRSGAQSVDEADSGISKDRAATSAVKFAAVFASLVAARDALQANDSSALNSAMAELHDSLDALSSDQGQHTALANRDFIFPTIIKNGSDSSQEHASDPNLVETIATLYHQETAYQASLKVSNRMLAAT